jgi:tetratricopeptide (TPR) repeat protein
LSTAATVLLCLTSGLAAPQTRPLFEQALDLYNRGEFDAAIALVEPGLHGLVILPGPGRTFSARRTEPDHSIEALTSSADRWIASGDPANRTRRQIIAASLALELAWRGAVEFSRLRAPFESNATYPNTSSVNQPKPAEIARSFPITDRRAQVLVIAWARDTLPRSGSVEPAERFWWLASVGVSEEAKAWLHLDEHLARARARVPDEPRWRLADLARRSRIDAHPAGSLDLVRPDGLDLLGDKTLYRQAAGRIPQLQSEFEKLGLELSLAGEIELNLGYLDLLRAQWASALSHLDRSRTLTDEPFLHAVADYLGGWANERLRRPAEALAAYRRANALVPHVRNLSFLLAGQLFLANERAEGYAVLDAAIHTDPAPPDLLTAFESGDARLVPSYLARLREALR